MPEYDDFADVGRAAADGADPPSFQELRSRGVRRHRRRTTTYAVAAVAAVVGTAGVTGTLVERSSVPQPAPPDVQPTALVLERHTGDTQRLEAGDFHLSCTSERGFAMLEATASLPAAGTGPRGSVLIRLPLEDVRHGARLRIPFESPVGDTVVDIADPAHDTAVSGGQRDSRGTLHVASANCAGRASLAFSVDGTLASEREAGPSIDVSGGLVLRGPAAEAEAPSTGARADEIVDATDSRLVDLATLPWDPAVHGAVWQSCPGGECRERYALAIVDDETGTRSVVGRVFREYPTLTADGVFLHVSAGWPTSGWVYDITGSEREVVPGAVDLDSHGPVVDMGSGRPVPAVVDVRTATVSPLPAEDGFAGTERVERLSDGDLLASDYQQDRVVLSVSEDNGRSWEVQDIPEAERLLYTGVPTAVMGGLPVLAGIADGGTLPWLAQVHRMESLGWATFGGPDDPAPAVAGQVVLPDGRLLSAVTNWTDDRPGRAGTAPGFYVSDGDDWSAFELVEVGQPFDSVERFQPEVLEISVSDGRATVVVRAPEGDEHPAYASTDGGLSWDPVPAR